MKQVLGLMQDPDSKQLLLQRMTSGDKAGYFTLPSGKMRDGEQPVDAMARVFEEVLGIKTTAADWALRITTADAYVCFCRGNIYRRRSVNSVFLPHDAALVREPLSPPDLQWMIPAALFCPCEVVTL